MKIGAVIVAAGMSSRMNDFKPMLTIGKLTMAERVIVNFKNAGVDEVVMVTGNRADVLEKQVKHLDVVFLQNKDYATTQMFASAKIGLRYLANLFDYVLFSPVDIPLFTVTTVKKLIACESEIAMPLYQNKKGHPIILSRNAIQKIIGYEGQQGLRGAIENTGYEITKVQVDDEGILNDADTKADFEKILELHNRQLFRSEVNVNLAKEKIFWDPGMAALLKQINYTESVREACGRLKISYSKGWTMLRIAEQELGFQVVVRYQGGKNGGNAYLTVQGREFLKRYERLAQEVSDVTEQKFKEILFQHANNSSGMDADFFAERLILKKQSKPEKMDKIIIFGAGQAGSMVSKWLGRTQQLICYTDNQNTRWGEKIDGVPVLSPADALKQKADAVWIAVLNQEACCDIKKQLAGMNFTGTILDTQEIRQRMDQRLAGLRLAAKEIYQRNVEGDVAELGVYQGEFAAEMNRIFPDRRLHLFDTFAGFAERDIFVETEHNYSRARVGDFVDTSIAAVKARLPHADLAVFYQGYFPETVPSVLPPLAFVSIDPDLYEPTYQGLKTFYPKLNVGGMIFIHDYNSTQFCGVREAVRKFCEEMRIYLFPLCDLHGSAVIVKQDKWES